MGLSLEDIELRYFGERVALLYSNSLVVVLNTTDGSLIEAHTQPAMSCTYGCFLVFSDDLVVSGRVIVSGQEYLGLHTIGQ